MTLSLMFTAIVIWVAAVILGVLGWWVAAMIAALCGTFVASSLVYRLIRYRAAASS